MKRLFARLWQTMRTQSRLVGRDLEGNNFYESAPDADGQRPRRTVEYKMNGDLWDTAAGISHLSAQWTAWLSHTRVNPPTLDELKSDQDRQERVAFNVARLKEKEEETRRRAEYHSPAILPRSDLDTAPRDLPESISSQAPPSKPIGPSPEPQAWTPHIVRKR